MGRLAIPFNTKLRSLRSGWRCKTIRIKDCSQSFGFNVVWNVFDGCDVGIPFKNITLELLVQVCVRISPWMWNGHR